MITGKRQISLCLLASISSLSFSSDAHAGVFRKSIEASIALHLGKNVAKHVLKEEEKALGKKIARKYIKHVEVSTGRKMTAEQKGHLMESLKQRELTNLSHSELRTATNEFNSQRNNMIKEWETKTGQKWPQYPAGHPKQGNNYDLHHIIPKKNGGPNTWWNSHPAANPNEHQALIHGQGGFLRQLQEIVKGK